MGTSQVPLSPERVVVIDTTPLDAAIALGIQPVGTIRYGAPPGYLGDAVTEIEVVGQYNQPNLETILRLDPDLILGAKSISASLYPRLSRIAPTVFIEGAGRSWDWKNNFRLFAEALGESEQAENLLANYQQQLEALKTSLNAPPQTITVSVLVSTPQGLVAHTPKSFSGSVLQEIGFTRNSTQGNDEQFFVRLPREDFESPDGDIVFLIHNPEWDGDSKAEFVNDPLWSQLDAVKRGAICEVAGDVWGSGRSILAANQILADVERCLEQSTTSFPHPSSPSPSSMHSKVKDSLDSGRSLHLEASMQGVDAVPTPQKQHWLQT
ncbi:MAG: iron-siderophore ABC transporter substrate-binding protein [Leptolyngbya sp. SIO1E4]|nr:iron-siderophore ABC transporter substrate-binding protein [Leptolyngbya sp. SIO1E4]